MNRTRIAHIGTKGVPLAPPLIIVPVPYIRYFVRFALFHGVKHFVFSLEGPKTEDVRYLNRSIKSAWLKV
jgi:hypothetical protein